MLIKHSVFTSLALSFFTVLCLAHYDFQKPDHEVGYPEPPSYPSEIPSVPPPTYPSEALSMTPPTYPSETLSMAPATYPPMTPPGPPPTKPSTAPSSSSSSCPTPTSPETDPIYLCPGDIEAKYIGQDGSQFDLKFCSNIYRWDPSDLTRSQSISNVTYMEAARQCSLDCAVPDCLAYSVAPRQAGGDTYNCNHYNNSRVFKGPTNGGLFYMRTEFPYPSPPTLDGPENCYGATLEVTNDRIYSRRFCSNTERWSPADLFSSRPINVTMSSNYTTPLSDASIQCAKQCTVNGDVCKTFSVTYRSPRSSPATFPLQFNCNLYNATNRVSAPTTGGAFYEKHLSQSTAETLCAQSATPPVVPASMPPDTTDTFNLGFCSTTKRWAASTLISSTPKTAKTAGEVAKACSAMCSFECVAFSVSLRVNADGKGNWNCNIYFAQEIADGATLGGLFYARLPGPQPERSYL